MILSKEKSFFQNALPFAEVKILLDMVIRGNVVPVV
jgi:hypothetical protein